MAAELPTSIRFGDSKGSQSGGQEPRLMVTLGGWQKYQCISGMGYAVSVQ